MDLIELQYSRFLESNPEFPQFSRPSLANGEHPIEISAESQVVGIGFPSHKDEGAWGKNCWLKFGEYGVQDSQSAKFLFTQIAKEQYDQGVRNFYIEVNANDSDLVQAFFELGFGLQHVSAIRRKVLSRKPISDFTLRPLLAEDLPAIALLERELSIHQMQSPVFSWAQPEPVEEIIREWEAELHEQNFVTSVALVDGDVAGFAYGCSTEKSGLHSGLLRPVNSATLAFCTVASEFRRRGIARALALEVFQGLEEKGFKNIVTDWRATNQLSSRTWPNLGFESTVLRLHRAI